MTIKKLIAIPTALAISASAVWGIASQEETEPTAEVELVLRSYKDALEALDVSETTALFTENSRIFETGKYEGSYTDYLAHHIGPELGHFVSFAFSDYEVDVQFEGSVALASETYNYRIEIEDRDPVERQGVATSALVEVDGEWRIAMMHNSSRPLRRTEVFE
jgi:ketosteroid isomerase-like protein